MTKQEIFTHIIDTCARVCNVPKEDIIGSRRNDSIVIARSIAVFWLDAAGFSVDDIMRCTGRKNHECVDTIKKSIEGRWVKIWDYHVFVKEVGDSLHDIGQSYGIDFDIWKPIRRIQAITGRKYYAII